MADEKKTEKIVSLAKRKGFIYPSSLIYGGLSGFWDFGPLGVQLKRNIENLWWEKFVLKRDDIYGLDTSIIMKSDVWRASGHAEGFSDPMVECQDCNRKFREDHLEDSKCPECGGELGQAQNFNMMFETRVGPTQNEDSKTYLRPETAQGIFTNFKNILDSYSPDFPFGVAQIGKAFRNEISPRDFVFRSREFSQMEVEYFVEEENWKEEFEKWLGEMREWNRMMGFGSENVYEYDTPDEELAHYSRKTIDFEYEYPFGRSELYGLAYRTDYDLRKHSDKSGTDLVYKMPEGEEIKPHVIEPTFGIERTVLALLAEHYKEDENRMWLSLPPRIAPFKAAVFPLLKNKEKLVKKAKAVYEGLKGEIPDITWDDHGNIGKRYARQDEIGTPFCITVDFDTLEGKDNPKDTVTVRDRDTAEQDRVKIENLANYLKEKINSW